MNTQQLECFSTLATTLTQAGWQFLPDARQSLDIYYRSREWMESFHKNEQRKVRLPCDIQWQRLQEI